MRSAIVLAGLAIVLAAAAARAGEEPSRAAGTVEFRINGEDVTREAILAGVREAAAGAPEICPTDEASAFEMRRARLVELIPVRQFLDREGVAVPAAEIDARIEAMKADPNPFGVSPPKPMNQVMARRAMSPDDVRLAVRIELGLARWAERERLKKWPSGKEWAAHAADRRAAFEKEHARLSRISFSLSRWPKGARDEPEALELLRQQAAAARRRIAAGESFEALAAEVRGVNREALPEPAVVPYAALGGETAEALRKLPEGGVSDPLPSPVGWSLWRKEPMSDAQASEAIKRDFLAGLQAEALRRIAAEARLEKVDWTGDAPAGDRPTDEGRRPAE